MATIKCTAAGDAMVMRRLPGSYPGFEELKNFISQGDFRFFNLETTIHNHETYGAAISGGTWFCSPRGSKVRTMDGWPRPKYDDGIIERLAKMSEPYGTKIEIDESGLGIVKL